ncbi:hypothetical protein [Acetivibrio ethanolgignens]|uniref:DNA-directed DNA polymerase family A palm domain-containing protein n=1 Tax=Acetivibrio ethanolgignens TaxID=290052 RepID=A0A0V8QBH3_9FIRM|nr:hypothetical protein [Acetivibrio ethanolgignens]KSV57906.1 hypothetical protein ASU35_14940 [Acetivibrio ethanolgignens]
MYRFTSKTPVDIDKFEERIKRNGSIAIVREDYEYAYKYDRGVEQTLLHKAIALVKHESGGNCFAIDKPSVLRYLQRYKNCPDRFFNNRKTQDESIALPILEKLAAAGYAQEFIELYSKYRSLYAINNKMRKMLQECVVPIGKNHYGDTLVNVPYNVGLQTNLRHNYRKFDIIAQISKENSNVISVEDGYVLVWGDLAQSDFRVAYNLFIRSEENDKVMSQYADKYEGFARLVNKANNIPFDAEKFKSERKLYKTMTLKVLYGGASGTTQEEQEFINRLTQFLKTCDRYQEFVRRLEHRLELNLGISITSYFGHVEVCPVYQYDSYSTKTRALNCPMQTGTSEIAMLIVNAILDEFYSLGYTEDDISLYILRHDEPVFKVKESVLKDAWVFEQFRTILVDDWIPLEMTVEAGYRYNRIDEGLMNQIAESCNKNKDKITVYDTNTETAISSYYPLPNSIQLHMHYNIVNDTAIVAVYEPTTSQVNYYAIDASERETLMYSMVAKILESKKALEKHDVATIEILSNNVKGSVYQDGEFFQFNTKSDVSMNNVVALCDYMTCLYCRKVGVPDVVSPPTVDYEEFVKTRKSIEVLNYDEERRETA